MTAKEIKETPIYHDKETELTASKIGPYEVMSFDITGTLFLNPMHCRVYFIELPNQYARLLCTSSEATWPKIEGAAGGDGEEYEVKGERITEKESLLS